MKTVEQTAMKVICDRAAFLDAINLVSGVVATRTPRPQLTCVKLTASVQGDAGSLELLATDTEVSLRLSTSSVDVQEPGEALIPADKLRQIVAAEDADATLTITTDQDMVQIRGQDAEFKVYGYPVSDFPPSPDFATAARDASAPLRVAAGDLARLVQRTLFATARETSRYAINGVLMRCEGKKVEMVATDGRRLAVARGALTEGVKGQAISCIIPSKALTLLSRLIDEADESVRIAITENQAHFALGDPDGAPRAVLTTSLVEGAFPPFEDVIPRDHDKEARFDVPTLTSAVRRAALLTNEESRGVRMHFEPEGAGATLLLSSRAPEMGEANITVRVDSYKGDAVEIGFNPQFLLDALKVVEEEQVALELKAPNKPGVIRSGSDFLYVVMPVNLQ